MEGFDWPSKKVPVAFVEMGRWAGESVEYESKMNQSEAERVVQILEWGASFPELCVIGPCWMRAAVRKMWG